jgi:hypothetical protein
LGKAIDSMLDYRRNEQLAMEGQGSDEDDQSALTDAIPDLYDEDGESADEQGNT